VRLLSKIILKRELPRKSLVFLNYFVSEGWGDGEMGKNTIHCSLSSLVTRHFLKVMSHKKEPAVAG
jgi:hypothetical protein